MYASPEDMKTLESDDKAPETFHDRVSAVWAHAHDLATEKYGESEIGKFFTDQSGLAHITALEGMPADSTAAEMLAKSKKIMGIEG